MTTTLKELESLLNDDLFSNSKDWVDANGNLAAKVAWLILAYKSKCEECELYLSLLEETNECANL